MPYAAPKICTRPGCRQLNCTQHKEEARKQYDRWRGSAASRGFGHNWRKLRLMTLHAQPTCVYCEAVGLVVPSDSVDHRLPKSKGGDDSPGNLAGTCQRCNYRKRDMTEAEFIAMRKRETW